jgi:outer membrane murein-binding lipoprotein Lpp
MIKKMTDDGFHSVSSDARYYVKHNKDLQTLEVEDRYNNDEVQFQISTENRANYHIHDVRFAGMTAEGYMDKIALVYQRENKYISYIDIYYPHPDPPIDSLGSVYPYTYVLLTSLDFNNDTSTFTSYDITHDLRTIVVGSPETQEVSIYSYVDIIRNYTHRTIRSTTTNFGSRVQAGDNSTSTIFVAAKDEVHVLDSGVLRYRLLSPLGQQSSFGVTLFLNSTGTTLYVGESSSTGSYVYIYPIQPYTLANNSPPVHTASITLDKYTDGTIPYILHASTDGQRVLVTERSNNPDYKITHLYVQDFNHNYVHMSSWKDMYFTGASKNLSMFVGTNMGKTYELIELEVVTMISHTNAARTEHLLDLVHTTLTNPYDTNNQLATTAADLATNVEALQRENFALYQPLVDRATPILQIVQDAQQTGELITRVNSILDDVDSTTEILLGTTSDLVDGAKALLDFPFYHNILSIATITIAVSQSATTLATNTEHLLDTVHTTLTSSYDTNNQLATTAADLAANVEALQRENFALYQPLVDRATPILQIVQDAQQTGELITRVNSILDDVNSTTEILLGTTADLVDGAKALLDFPFYHNILSIATITIAVSQSATTLATNTEHLLDTVHTTLTSSYDTNNQLATTVADLAANVEALQRENFALYQPLVDRATPILEVAQNLVQLESMGFDVNNNSTDTSIATLLSSISTIEDVIAKSTDTYSNLTNELIREYVNGHNISLLNKRVLVKQILRDLWERSPKQHQNWIATPEDVQLLLPDNYEIPEVLKETTISVLVTGSSVANTINIPEDVLVVHVPTIVENTNLSLVFQEECQIIFRKNVGGLYQVQREDGTWGVSQPTGGVYVHNCGHREITLIWGTVTIIVSAYTASAGGDPYIFPCIGPPVKLPNVPAIYRLYQDTSVIINATVEPATTTAQAQIHALFDNIGDGFISPLSANAFFFSQLYVGTTNGVAHVLVDLEQKNIQSMCSNDFFTVGKPFVDTGPQQPYERINNEQRSRISLCVRWLSKCLTISYSRNPQIRNGITLTGTIPTQCTGLLVRNYRSKLFTLDNIAQVTPVVLKPNCRRTTTQRGIAGHQECMVYIAAS